MLSMQYLTVILWEDRYGQYFFHDTRGEGKGDCKMLLMAQQQVKKCLLKK